ncbi:type I secretion system permease/ATPase [Ferrimonas senticii]|uniref:type I secretion system permease/ATPase n=1 Tax=Ferrimonas senticii TaxID=394566 RepID=UPI0003F4BE1E|nr:type I secretion system permease/ATPase [Ferrimonas senticii]
MTDSLARSVTESASGLPQEAAATPAAQANTSADSPLLENLLWLAQFFEQRVNRSAITAGLPLPGGDLPLSHFSQAAERAGLACRSLSLPLSQLSAPALPCLIALADDPPVVLLALNHERATLLDPLTHGQIEWSRTRLEQQYLGHLIAVKPKLALLDQPEQQPPPSQHWFWGPLRRTAPLYRDIILGSLLINLFALVSPLFIMNVYDRIVPNLAYDSLWVLAVGAGLAYLFDFALKQVRASLIDYAGKQTDLAVSRTLFAKIMGLQLQHKPGATGALARKFSDFDSVREFIASTTIVTLVDLPFSLLFLLIIGYVGGPLVWPALIAIGLMIVITAALQRQMAAAAQQAQRFADLRHNHLYESLMALETIKTSGAEGAVQHTWEQLQAHNADWQMRSRRLTNIASNSASFIVQLCSVITVVLGVYCVEAGVISMGGIIAAVILGSRAISPMSQLINLLSRAHNVKATLEQLDQLMQLPQESASHKHYPDLGRLQGNISADNWQFSYPGQAQPALRDLNFTLAAGQRLAIIGRNGSGKSTLVKALLGLLRSDHGGLRLDNHEIKQLHSGALRQQIGYVPQEIKLFRGTIADNITLGCRHISEAQLKLAVERSGVGLFTNLDSEGLNRQVGEAGLALSAGQRQAVALARALLTDPPVLLLDEPTASLDARAELQFIRTIKQLPRDKTLVLVTHKQALMELADQLMILERGRLVAVGPRQQVLQRLQQNSGEASA